MNPQQLWDAAFEKYGERPTRPFFVKWLVFSMIAVTATAILANLALSTLTLWAFSLSVIGYLLYAVCWVVDTMVANNRIVNRYKRGLATVALEQEVEELDRQVAQLREEG